MSAPYGPSWQQPNPDGQLAQSHTPLLKSRYMNSRGSADPAGQARFTASRIGSAAGLYSTPSEVWNTGWLGAPTITAMPLARYSFGCAQYKDRVYICGGIDGSGTVKGDVWSASVGGGSVGSWRPEKPMAVRPAVNRGGAILIGRHGMGCTAANFGTANIDTLSPTHKGQGGTPWLIIFGGFEVIGPGTGLAASNSMIAAPILGDGVLGDWITLGYGSWANLAWCHLLAVPNQYMTTALVLSGGVSTSGGAAFNNAYATIIRDAPANAQSAFDWDIPGGWHQPLTTVGAPATAGHAMAYDWANSTLLWFKGTSNSGGISQKGFYYSGFGVDVSSWVLSNLGTSWSAGSAADSIDQQNAALIYFGAQAGGGSGGSPTSKVYLLGGTSSSTNAGDTGSPQNIVRYTTITWNPTPVAAAWSAATVLPAAATGLRAFIHEHGLEQGQLYGYPPWCDPNLVYVTELGGATAIGTVTNAVRTTTLPSVAGSGGYTTSGGNISAWQTGTGAGLATIDMGAGGSVVASSDPTAPAGSQDVSIAYGQITTGGTLSDGDLVQVSARYTDKVSGDASPIRSSIIRIGAAPTVTGIAVASTATGQPLVSWAFNGGIGGQPQATWRCVVTVTAGGAVMFDSGTVLGQANQVQVKVAPVLANVSHTATVTVTSSDNPITGATATATGTLVFTPTTAAAPGVPTGFNVVPDALNYWDLATWTNGANTTSNRIYHRRFGTSAWTLLLEYTAVAGAQSIRLMDKIPLGVGLDFAISALGGTTASESALSSTISNVVLPAPLASPSGYLHLAGQPLTGAPGAYVNAQVQPTMSANYASKVFTSFNGSRATVRQGPLDYRKLDVELLTITLTAQKGLQTLVDALLAGGVAYWRGRNGGEMFPVALDNPQEIVTLYPSYRDFKLHLVEVADLYAPYVSSGSAVGIPTLVYGSIPPLDIAERVA